MPDLAGKIRNALSEKKPDLLADARQLLNALEYESERTMDETHPPADFLRQYAPKNGGGVNARELKEQAGKIGVVFQVTDEEIRQTSGLYSAAFQPDDERSFIFVAVDLKGDHYPRWRLARMTRAVNRCFASPAVVLFRHPDAAAADAVSLAFIHRRQSKTDSAKDVLGRVSVLRAVNRDSPHRGHLDILQDLALSARLEWMTRESKTPANFDGLLAAWLAALDVEELNRRFYRELQEWFDRAVMACKFPDGNSKEKKQAQVMRMITRLLFIWFVKEKGLVPEKLFTEDFARQTLKNHKPDNAAYYRAVLQNLFFATLNTRGENRRFRERDERGNPTPKQYRDFTLCHYEDLMKAPRDFLAAIKPVPFVNGGLFDCLDGDQTGGHRKDRRRVDCFTDNPIHRKLLNVPSRIFFDPQTGLFPLFNQFKFTVAENTPLDQEVALDPELLGMVFENLLAAITPESRENARKQTGSFYTPRPIVEYMVDEALVARLADALGAKSETKLRTLLGWGDAPPNLFSEGEKNKIIAAIDKLRILDPAVGSGAFPMGMLHKLVHILSRVDPQNAKWKNTQAARAAEIPDPAVRKDAMENIENVFAEENNFGDYGRKLYLVQRVIHGADLQPVAAQIARLRFFISLVIDQRPRGDRPNRGIAPLPNLETKFVAADSLIALAQKGQGALAETEEVRNMQAQINAVRADYFAAKTRTEKNRLRNRDFKLRADLAKTLKRMGFAETDADRYAQWDLYDQTAGADWFDAELMMGVRNGFDIVIGNPPYVRHELFAAKKPALRAQFGNFFSGTADLYTYFYHRGLSELRKGGHLCFITSNGFMRGGYGENTRKFLSADCTVRSVLDFSGVSVFDAAVDSVIVHARKAPALADSKFIGTFAGGVKDIDDIADFVHEHGESLPIRQCLAGQEWVVHKGNSAWPLLAKMRRVGRTLHASGPVQIRMGIKTGCNAAFVIDKETRDKLIAEDEKSAEIIKPWIRGRDICKWRTESETLYIISVVSSANHQWPWSGMAEEAEKIFAEQYSAIYRHLSNYRKQLKGRTDRVAFWWELRSCDYYEEFNSSKIFYPDIAQAMRGTYDETGMLCGNTAYILATDDLSLLGFFHSQAFDWYARYAFQALGSPWHQGGLRFFAQSMERVPIPPMDKGDKAEISRRVNAILRSPSGSEVPRLESEIDEIVSRLYGLTPSEVRLVEGEG